MNPVNLLLSLSSNVLKRPFLGHLQAILPLSLALWASGCASGPERPIVVTVNEPPNHGGRFRSPERQRDVWIAPQATGNEVLQHDQTVTFVEKPAAWQLPSIVEPHTVSKPDLPLEAGEYDAEVVHRQKEILTDTQAQIKRLSADLETLKKESGKEIKARDEVAESISRQLLEARQQTAQVSKELAEKEASENARQEAEGRKKSEKKWWQLWK